MNIKRLWSLRYKGISYVRYTQITKKKKDSTLSKQKYSGKKNN